MANFNGHPHSWIAYYSSDTSWATSDVTLELPLALPLILRWLYLHSVYYTIRQMRDLESYTDSILLLIRSGESLHSSNTFKELCGFVPSSAPTWKLYTQTRPTYKRGRLSDPTATFVLASEGERHKVVAAIRKLLKNSERWGSIVLDPTNRIVHCSPHENPHDRHKHNWESIFNEQTEAGLPSWDVLNSAAVFEMNFGGLHLVKADDWKM